MQLFALFPIPSAQTALTEIGSTTYPVLQDVLPLIYILAGLAVIIWAFRKLTNWM